jgi:hypothetical protein
MDAEKPARREWLATLANDFEDRHNCEVHWITGDKDRMMLAERTLAAPPSGMPPGNEIIADLIAKENAG